MPSLKLRQSKKASAGEGGEGGITFSDPRKGSQKENNGSSNAFLLSLPVSKQALHSSLQQKAPLLRSLPLFSFCGEGGIRTLGTGLSPYNGLANRPFRPLRHLSRLRETKVLLAARNPKKQIPNSRCFDWNLGFYNLEF